MVIHQNYGVPYLISPFVIPGKLISLEWEREREVSQWNEEALTTHALILEKAQYSFVHGTLFSSLFQIQIGISHANSFSVYFNSSWRFFSFSRSHFWFYCCNLGICIAFDTFLLDNLKSKLLEKEIIFVRFRGLTFRLSISFGQLGFSFFAYSIVWICDMATRLKKMSWCLLLICHILLKWVIWNSCFNDG